MEFEKDSNPRKGVLFLRTGTRFSGLHKGLDLHILRS